MRRLGPARGLAEDFARDAVIPLASQQDLLSELNVPLSLTEQGTVAEHLVDA